MAQVILSVLAAMFQSFNTLFNKGVASVDSYWEKISMKVPSSGAQENYAWLGNMPLLREWIGERAIKKLIKKSYSIKNKKFEATVEIKREEIEDDTCGVYSPVIQNMGESAAAWPDQLTFELLANGFTEKCYDDQPFFSNNHPVGDNKVSNTNKKPLSLGNFKEARSLMMKYKNDEGKPLGIVPNVLVVGPDLEDTARQILEADFVNDGGTMVSNTSKGLAELLVVPWLAGHDGKWFLLDTRKAIKPLIFQERRAPEFKSITDPTSDHVFMNDAFLYGVDARGNVGFSFWQLAFGSTGK